MTAGRAFVRRGAAAAVSCVLLAAGLAGCNLLFGGSDSGSFFATPSGGIIGPSPRATYTSGSATITLGDGAVVKLDRLNGGAQLLAGFGANVRWSNTQGWSMRVAGAGMDLGGGLPPAETAAFLTLDRIVAGKHLSTLDPTRCVVTVTTVDEKALRGKASCKGLEWVDALDVPTLGEPPDTGAPKFDAEITFEATS
ncbi:MAG TPA: hypothetical protein VGJ46_02290 [Candidatus Limnocylindrales bacterium]|jgi:hypothetical protein